MSIKGIDTQIMITRTPEVSRDASIVQQRPEVNQALLAEQRNKAIARDETRVKELEEPAEAERIRTDEDGGGNNAYYGQDGSNQGEDGLTDEKGRPGMLVPPRDHILDILV